MHQSKEELIEDVYKMDDFGITAIRIVVTILILFLVVFGVLCVYGIKNNYIKPSMIYSCDSYFYSDFYNCPLDMKYKNATGLYCDGYLICENLWSNLK